MDAELPGLVVDVETTMKCPVGNNKANPFWPENKMVLHGWAHLDSRFPVTRQSESSSPMRLTTKRFLIGHNIAFDLHYLLKEGRIGKEQYANLTIWDTQLAEYLLSGQQEKWASLDEVALRRGGTVKDSRVSDMFAAGKGADEVPPAMLEEYLKADLDNTRKVFWSQFAEAMDKDMLPLIWSQMDARLATIEMVYNGMAIDRTFLGTRTKELEEEVKNLSSLLVLPVYENGVSATLNLTSPHQLSTYLFGGTISEVVDEKVGVYKSGKDKFKKVEHTTKFSGVLPGLKRTEWLGKNEKYSTADEVLEVLLGERLCPPVKRLLETVQDYRDKKKQLSTYFEAIDKLLMPDGMLHANISHVTTNTGRLACSEPNLQNQSTKNTSDIKKAFVSRWGDDGVVAEADYSQLEMVVLSVLSGDAQLQEDIRNGVDTHRELFYAIHRRYPTEGERWWFKRCTFALVYGGGVGAIAAQGRTDRSTANRFIAAFYDRYPGVKEWHERLIKEVKDARIVGGLKDNETGFPCGEAIYTSPLSNRRYYFREYVNDVDKRPWAGLTSFSPQEIKNYPVQGGATADIVPLVLGQLFRVLKNNPVLRDKCLMVMTVHDSIVFDIHKSVLQQALRTIHRVMESAPDLIKQTWGSEFPMKLKTGLSHGPNWFEQKLV